VRSNSAVFLDRDGVLNRSRTREGRRVPPASLSELELLAQVPEACKALRDAGFLLVMVTNQPDVARGTQRRDTVEAINAVLSRLLSLDDVRVCYHDDSDRCACRKPAPGLLTDAAADWGIDLSQSFMVGDRSRDIEAGRRAGCRTFLIDDEPGSPQSCVPDRSVRSLAEAAMVIVAEKRASV
jgi:D-glycero-D-manno-heptose 1,7-bisphosphate phosphatase